MESQEYLQDAVKIRFKRQLRERKGVWKPLLFLDVRCVPTDVMVISSGDLYAAVANKLHPQSPSGSTSSRAPSASVSALIV